MCMCIHPFPSDWMTGCIMFNSCFLPHFIDVFLNNFRTVTINTSWESNSTISHRLKRLQTHKLLYSSLLFASHEHTPNRRRISFGLRSLSIFIYPFERFGVNADSIWKNFLFDRSFVCGRRRKPLLWEFIFLFASNRWKVFKNYGFRKFGFRAISNEFSNRSICSANLPTHTPTNTLRLTHKHQMILDHFHCDANLQSH